MANRYRTCRYFAAILLLSQAILHAAGISSQQPAPGTTNVPVNSSLTISFDEDVSADAGAITIMRSHNLTEFEQIEVGASNVFMDSVIFDFDTDNEGFVEADSTVENAPLWTDERTFSSGGAIETKFLSLEKDFATVQDWSSYDTLLVWIYSDVETHVAYRFHSGEYKNGFDQQPHPGMPVGVGWNRLTIGLDEMSGIDLTEVKSFWLVNNGTASTFYVDRFALKRSGSANVTIIPSQPFEDSVTYFVQIGATAFLGASGDHFAGLSEPSDWRFSTGDEIVAGPDHYYWDTSPADGYQAGDGEWGTDAFWTVNGNGLLAWPGGNSSAQFDGEDGEAGEYAVAVLDTQSTDSIVFNASGYALDGGALAITGGNPSIITAADATITSSLISAATLSKRGSSQLSVTGNVEHQIDQLDLLDGKTVLGTGLFNLNDLRVVGDLEVSGATIDVSGDVVFGDSASATVVLDGTTDAANGVIGRNAGPVVTITDGNHTFSGALYHLDGGNAILNINGGVVSAPQVYSLSNEEADEFTINLNEGGTLETGRIYLSLGATATDAGTHTFQVAFDGGVLEVTDDSDPLFDDIIGEGESESSFEISVLGGGAHINTNGFNPLIRRPITHGGVDALDGGLTKLGEGVLTLAAGAKHTGLTDIQEGTLRLGADNILPHGSGYGNIHIDGTLNLNGHSDTVNGLAGAGTITNAAEQAAVLTVGANDDDFVFDGIIEDGIGQVAFAKEGEGRVTLSADNTFSGGLTVGEGALQIGDGGTSGSVDGDIENNAILVFDRSDSLVFNGTITGVGELNQDGSGMLVLGGENSYTGGTRINSGSVTAKTGASLGTEIVRINRGAGQLVLDGDFTFGNQMVIDSGVGPESGAGIIVSTGNDTLSGAIGILGNANSGIHFSGAGESESLVITGAIEAEPGVAVSILHENAQLSGGGNYGQLDILEGTITLGADSGISDGAVIAMAGSGDAVLDLNGFNQPVAGILSDEANAATVTNSNESASSLLLDIDDTSYTYNGTVSGNLSLIKTGNGGKTLAGENSYSGATTVDGGVLRVEGSFTGQGELTVAKGTTLDLAESVSGSISVADSGILAVDTEGSKTISTGGLSLEQNSIVDIGIDSVSDAIIIEGDLVLDGLLDIELGEEANPGTYTIMTCSGVITDNVLEIGDAPGMVLYEIHVVENEVQLEIIRPEITPIHNPLVLSGEQISDGLVQIKVTGFKDIPTLENNFGPWADSIGIWYKAGSYHTTPDLDADYVRLYSLQNIKGVKADTFTTTVAIPSADPGQSNYYYFTGTVFWHNPDSIPPFRISNGDSVKVNTVTISNPLEISSTFDEQENEVAVTVTGITDIPDNADSIGVWYGLEEQPNFSSSVESRWFSVDAFEGDTYTDTVDEAFFGSTHVLFYAVVIKDTTGGLSEAKTGSQTIGRERPENGLVLTATATGAQTVVLDWNSEAFDSDSVRIWYGTDSIAPAQSLVEGERVFVLRPTHLQQSDTVHTLLPSTTYFFGLQRFEDGLWSHVTEQSIVKVTTLDAGPGVINTIVLTDLTYDDELHEIKAYWEVDTTGYGEYDLEIGVDYSFNGYSAIAGPKTKVKDVTSLKDSITISFTEGILFDTLCYVSLYLRVKNGVFSSAEENSRDTIRTSGYTTQNVYLFENGVHEASVFNNKVVFKPSSDYNEGNPFKVDYYQPDTAMLNGFVPAGLSFRFDVSIETPEFFIGIRYDSIPQGYTENDLRLYRVQQNNSVHVEHESYVQDGVVWVKTNAIQQPFLLLADTLKPQLTFGVDDTGAAITANGDVLPQRFSLSDNSANVKYTVQASTGDKLFEFEKQGILTGTSASLVANIPKKDNGQFIGCVSESYGLRAHIIVTDGVHVDTINISRRVLTDNIGELSTPRIKPGWVPLAVRGTLTDSSLVSVLDELEDEESGEWEYDPFRFRLFRYMGKNDPLANDDGWLEYEDSVSQHFRVSPGRLLWLKTKEYQLIKLGEGKTTSLKDTFEITLKPGQWTDFAMPFQFDVPLRDVLAASGDDIDSIQLYHWEKDEDDIYHATELYISSFEELESVASEEVLSGAVDKCGYTAFNPLERSVVVRIPPVPETNQGSAKRVALRKETRSQWGVWFDWREAESGGSRKIRCMVDGDIPNNQVYALAPSFGSVGAGVVDTSNQTLGGHSITRDGGQQGYSWQIVLYNQAKESRKIAYSLDYLSSLPADMHARIWDPEKQIFENLGDEGLQETLAPSSEKTKWIVVGTQAYMNDFRRSVPGAKLSLAGCFPNPFVGRLSIRYSIPRETFKQIGFSIYDVRGRLIWQEIIREPAHGNRIHVWDGLTSENRRVASGQYILRMTAVTAKGVRKIVGEQRIAYFPR